MPWIITNKNYTCTDEQFKSVNLKEFTVHYKFGSRFLNDKIVLNERDYFFLLDGVLLNKFELTQASHVESLDEWFKYSVSRTSGKVDFINDLRGPFTGLYIDHENEKVFAFPNQTGDTGVFYYSNEETFIASSDFNLVYRALKQLGISVVPNEISIRNFLSIGNLIEDNTIIRDIFRVMPGYCVINTRQTTVVEQYHEFTINIQDGQSREAAIDSIDFHFRKAIKRCFEKDLEYGYSHLVDLSGGLDSRMVTWVANEMGYKNITNMCYAKKNSVEEKYATTVAKTLGNEFIFKYLDDLRFLYDVDEIITLNYGMVSYSAITGGKRFLEGLSFDKFGLEHTGLLGDEILGASNTRGSCDAKPDIMSFVENANIRPETRFIDNYDNQDLFGIHYGGFMGNLSSAFIRRGYTEIVSPFIDVDFLQCCIDIPVEYKKNHKLYWEWIDRKYPDAGKLPSTTTRPIKQKMRIRSFVGAALGSNKLKVKLLLKKIGLFGIIQSKNSMNPLDYWYETTPALREYLDSYYEENIGLVTKYPAIREMVETKYHNDQFSEKALAITVLGTMKRYFEEE